MKPAEACPACPKCASARVVPIGYGYPGPEMEAQHKRGELALGGCCINLDEPLPKWSCRDCGERFGSINL